MPRRRHASAVAPTRRKTSPGPGRSRLNARPAMIAKRRAPTGPRAAAPRAGAAGRPRACRRWRSGSTPPARRPASARPASPPPAAGGWREAARAPPVGSRPDACRRRGRTRRRIPRATGAPPRGRRRHGPREPPPRPRSGVAVGLARGRGSRVVGGAGGALDRAASGHGGGVELRARHGGFLVSGGPDGGTQPVVTSPTGGAPHGVLPTFRHNPAR